MLGQCWKGDSHSFTLPTICTICRQEGWDMAGKVTFIVLHSNKLYNLQTRMLERGLDSDSHSFTQQQFVQFVAKNARTMLER